MVISLFFPFTQAIMLLNGYAYFWDLAGALLTSWNVAPDSEIVQSVAFMLVLSLFSTVVDLPFVVYYTFWLEERHGFNKQTPAFFVKDTIKKFVVGQLITAPLVAGLVYIVLRGGQYFFVYLWVFVTVVILLLMTVYPVYIAPLFDKVRALVFGAKFASKFNRK